MVQRELLSILLFFFYYPHFVIVFVFIHLNDQTVFVWGLILFAWVFFFLDTLAFGVAKKGEILTPPPPKKKDFPANFDRIGHALCHYVLLYFFVLVWYVKCSQPSP